MYLHTRYSSVHYMYLTGFLACTRDTIAVRQEIKARKRQSCLSRKDMMGLRSRNAQDGSI